MLPPPPPLAVISETLPAKCQVPVTQPLRPPCITLYTITPSKIWINNLFFYPATEKDCEIEFSKEKDFWAGFNDLITHEFWCQTLWIWMQFSIIKSFYWLWRNLITLLLSMSYQYHIIDEVFHQETKTAFIYSDNFSFYRTFNYTLSPLWWI